MHRYRDRRRFAVAVGSSAILAAAVIQAAKSGPWAFLGTRIMIGIRLACAQTSATPLTTEVARPKHRGQITALFQATWLWGSIRISCRDPALQSPNERTLHQPDLGLRCRGFQAICQPDCFGYVGMEAVFCVHWHTYCNGPCDILPLPGNERPSSGGNSFVLDGGSDGFLMPFARDLAVHDKTPSATHSEVANRGTTV